MSIPIDDQNLIKILGIESLPDERKLELIDKASALVEKRIFLRLLNSLTDQKRQEFENLLDSENSEAIGLFMEQNAEDLPQWITEETLKIKQEMANLASAA